MKRSLFLLLITCLLTALFCCFHTADAATYGDLTYEVSNGKVTITGCSTSATSVTIPETINGYPVTSIGDRAFYNCTSLTSIVIPDSVTSIGEYAFYSCDRLTSIVIPDSVTSIGSGAFYSCDSLESIVIPDSVTSIGRNTFAYCDSLTSIVIHDSVTSIGSSAFAWCDSLTSIVIPDSVTSIGNKAFEYCTSLESIVIPDSVTSISYRAFWSCTSLESIVIPDSVTSIGSYTFAYCGSLTSILIPDSVTSIGEYAFSSCDSLTSIVIPDSVTSIGEYAFYNCDSLRTVNYYGGSSDWNRISIGSNNTNLTSATRIYKTYVKITDVDTGEYVKFDHTNGQPVSEEYYKKQGYTATLYTDEACTQIFDISSPITKNTKLYVKYLAIVCSHVFRDHDGIELLRNEIPYGTVIVPPADPFRPATDEYTYTFAGWEGYTEGMTQTDEELVFTAKYNSVKNKYTYRFLDNNGDVLKTATVNYGTLITPPATPADKDPYTFDYWQGYSNGMVVTGDTTVTAVYKYKSYTVSVHGSPSQFAATYNSNFTVDPQAKEGYSFIGYFTEPDGNGQKITDSNGASLSAYAVVGDLMVYPYFYTDYMNKVVPRGTPFAMPGDTIAQNVTFATDKAASYFIATLKYPAFLSFRSISAVDFKEATATEERAEGQYKFIDITCIYDYEGNSVPQNTNLVPFEAEFCIATDAPIGQSGIYLENASLAGDITFDFADITDAVFEITPKLSESVGISGSTSIDSSTQYTANVMPSYTTDKSVVWSVNDESVATISPDGILTPVRNGTVTITATASDGSGAFGTKTVSVTAYAKLNSLVSDKGTWNVSFDPEVREYFITVDSDVESITLTPTFVGGVLNLANGNIWINGRGMTFDIDPSGTVITLHRRNVTGLTDCVYTINISMDLIKGDVNGDGTVNRLDLLRLAKHFAGYEVEFAAWSADVNGDDDVTNADLLRLAKYLSGWDVTLG